MEGGEKGRYVIFVAVIGALATISVPLINHWFPAKQQEESSRPGSVPAATAANPGSEHISTKTEPAATKIESPAKRLPPAARQKTQSAHEVSPHRKFDVAESEALAREYLRSGNWSAAEKELGDLIKLEPSDQTLRGCLANLSVQNGEFAKASEEFRRAGELGAPHALDDAARIKAHEAALQKAYDYTPDGGFTDSDWETLQELKTSRIPGALNLVKRLCHGLRMKLDSIPNSQNSELVQWMRKKDDGCSGLEEDPLPYCKTVRVEQ